MGGMKKRQTLPSVGWCENTTQEGYREKRFSPLDSRQPSEHNGEVGVGRGVQPVRTPAGTGGSMEWLVQTFLEELVVVLALLAVAVVVVAYVVGRVRPGAAQQEPSASELLAKFRELHSQGELSDAEFRTIKTTLGVNLQQELNSSGETGYTAKGP
jgi:uncharacterized membrane protein